ncbi:MAG: thiamine pyrophosphate-binding protein [Chloroflexia bacterium]|nr:thiamine pyrophosphate-binding protein [Chloroflexia bacterium]MDQ3413013.1 thiamine pyrophosphate-binding protein [Chloroflexota bacterium]
MVQTRERPAAAEAQPAKPQALTGGEALVASLIGEGIDTIFGLPGVQLDGAFDALYTERDRVRVLQTRHEQGAAYMADGYARASGKVGTCLVVPGPGLLNAAAALSTAYACNSPVLCVTGQIQSDLIEVGRGLLHEIPNQLGMVRSVTKHAARAMTPGDIPGLVGEAFRQLRTGRPRPVEIEVPPDILLATGEVTLSGPGPRPEPAAPDPEQIEIAAKLLGAAKRPLIWSGGGILRAGAGPELLRLAELLQAPVVMSQNGKGAIADDHYLAHNTVGAVDLLPAADVVLVAGSRFALDSLSGLSKFAVGKTIIHIDIDPEELVRNRVPNVGIEADARLGLAALADGIERHNISRPSRRSELMELKRSVAARLGAIVPQAEYGLAIRRALPRDGVFVSEMTQIGYWSNFGFPVYEPLTYITPGYQGTLGYGFPTALGAKVAKPGVPVVSVNGDGGFGFCLNELATMAQHQIAAVVLVFNDNAYGNVLRIQQEQFDGRAIASTLVNPDYRKLADSFGIAGRMAETPAALERQLTESFKADEPALIHIPVGPMPNPWRQLGLR